MALAKHKTDEGPKGSFRRQGTGGVPLCGPRAASRKCLWIALAMISGYMLVEVVFGLIANSLALLADAAHMVTDAAAIGLALLAMRIAERPPSTRRTFGFQRTEVLAALFNALGLWLVAAWIFIQAYRRFTSPPEVEGILMLGVGSVGLLVNLGAAWVLRRSAGQSLNVEGAFLHLLGDLLGSIAVVIAGILILSFGWFVADPIFGVIIGLLILLGSGRLLWKVLHVLMEGTPSRLDLQRLCRCLEQVEGVIGVHDIHAWSITTGYDVLSAHVTTDMATVEETKHLLQRLREVAAVGFGIAHVTIQLEYSSDERCAENHHIAHFRGTTPATR